MKKSILALVLIISLLLTGCSKTESAGTESHVDIDLTSLSTTVAYSELVNILNDPESYTGKQIKMTGDYYNFTNEDGSIFYPACIVSDVTACCSQGMEFVLVDNKYPSEGTAITVSGVFRSYVDEYDNMIYYHLENAVLY